MTCAKKVVTCTLWNPETENTIVGTNWCRNPQVTCPRAPGEGYEKCKTICDQFGHAEETALYMLHHTNPDATGYHATVGGIGWACRSCQEKLYAAGIESIRCVI